MHELRGRPIDTDEQLLSLADISQDWKLAGCKPPFSDNWRYFFGNEFEKVFETMRNEGEIVTGRRTLPDGSVVVFVKAAQR